jgi:hypothetical protein
MTEEDERDDNDQSTSGQDGRSYSITVALDRERFLRRTCPNCGLDFKTSVSEADLGWILANEVQRSSEFLAGTAVPDDQGPTILCPYCSTEAPATKMHTYETMAYIRRFALREIALPMIDKMFSGLSSSNNRSGSFISISMEYSRGVRPIRPSCGPEPPDMLIVELLCCGEAIKVGPAGFDLKRCPLCMAAVVMP